MDKVQSLFEQLDKKLSDNIDEVYFQNPKDFRFMVEVLEILGEKAEQIEKKGGQDLLEALKHQNPAYNKVINHEILVRKVIDDVITCQQNGLHNSVETVSSVLKEYSQGQSDIAELRKSLKETKSVLTAKKSGQIAMKDLWSKKKELEETLRILHDLEWLKDTPLRLQRLVQQKRYFNAVGRLNIALDRIFSEDLSEVKGIGHICEQLLELKGRILEDIVNELRDDVVGIHSQISLLNSNEENASDNESVEDETESRLDKFNHLNANRHNVTAENKRKSSSEYGTADDSFQGLLSVNELIEMSVPDITTSGSIYIRLLVRSVGLLRCEDDVERLLLESASSKFHHVVRQIRQYAYTNYKKQLMKLAETEDSVSISVDLTQSITTQCFTEFVTLLLESAIALLKKLLYVLKLLNLSKFLSENGLSKFEDGSSNSASIDSVLATWNYFIEETNKKSVLLLWSEVENILISELKLHFVEKDVENISDNKSSHLNSPPDSMLIQDFETNSKNDYLDNDESSYVNDDLIPVFPPSVKLSASVYRLILSYVDTFQYIMISEGLSSLSRGNISGLGSLNTSTHSNDVDKSKSSYKLQKQTVMSLLQSSLPDTTIESQLLVSVQMVLTDDFLPVVQGSINQGMRELQLNSLQYFMPVNATSQSFMSAESNNTYSVLGSISSNSNSLVSIASSSVSPCLAAQYCLKAAKPLFTYWLQLPQQSNMVTTILDRLIRGYVAAGREEVENLTWKLLSAREKLRIPVLNAMKTGNDSWFTVYHKLLLHGKTSLDEIVQSFYSNIDSRNSSGVNLRGSSSSLTLSEGTSEWAMLWDISNPTYIVSVDKVIRDFSVIKTIASIASGADFLVMNLVKLCDSAMKKLQSIINTNQNQSNHLDTQLNRFGGIRLTYSKSSKAEAIEMQQAMVSSFQGYIKDLLRLSDDIWSLLRAEVQIASFYYLHQLAHLKFLTHTSSTFNYTDQTSSSLSKAAANSASANNLILVGNSTSQTAVESNIVTLLSQHLVKFHDSLSSATFLGPGIVMTMIMFPLAKLIPKILLRCISHLFLVASTSYKPNKSNVTSNQGSLGGQDQLQQENKTRLLKLVVICQQSLNMLFESIPTSTMSVTGSLPQGSNSVSGVGRVLNVDSKEYKTLHDIASDAFDSVRRYVSLMDLSMNELKSFITVNITTSAVPSTVSVGAGIRGSVSNINKSNQKGNSQYVLKYSYEEYKSIWRYVQERQSLSSSAQHDFDVFWKQVNGNI